MSATIVQHGFEVPLSSRQDIVSALLNEYGSFGDDDAASPHPYSPAPPSSKLPAPPPPPRNPERIRTNSNDKSMPYGGRLSMRFQLRVDEPQEPESSDDSRSSTDSQPQHIRYRSISRDSKPPSLKLLASNGSTAKLPPVPILATEVPAPATSPRAPRENKSLPPPPPAQDSAHQQQTLMGNQASSERVPGSGSPPPPPEKSSARPVVAPLKRKPLTKFTSLLDLRNGPRGGKGGPMPVPRSQIPTLDQPRSESRIAKVRSAFEAKMADASVHSTDTLRKSRSNEESLPKSLPPVPVMNTLPPTPTPNDDPVPTPPPKKPFAGIGLPSNPRSKHIKGKSSTGFGWVMSPTASSAPTHTSAPETLTPGPSPSSKETEQEQSANHAEKDDQRRPFSFEPPALPSPPNRQEQPAPAPAPIPTAYALQEQESTLSASGRPAPSVPSISPPSNSDADPTPPTPSSISRLPAAFANLPSQMPQLDSPASLASPVKADQPLTPDAPRPATPIFTPLTAQPMPITVTMPITSKHLDCYAKHNDYVWSKNNCQPMACMLCKSNQRERKWACTWCYLRICVECAEQLRSTPGKDLRVLMQKKCLDVGGLSSNGGNIGKRAEGGFREEMPKRHDSGTTQTPNVVVWKAEE